MSEAKSDSANGAARSAPAIGCPSAKRMATAGDDCSQLAVARPRSLSHESGGEPSRCCADCEFCEERFVCSDGEFE